MRNPPAAGASAPARRQDDLFSDLGPAVDAGFTTGRRIELDQASWIEHVPGWLRGSGGLFDELMATAPWEQRDRYIYARRVTEPRLTAECDDISAAPQQLLHVITATLAQHYGVAYRYLWLNLYRTHRDSISENTVRQYISRARAKYAATGRTATSKDTLLARAIEDGVIKPGEIMPYQSFARTAAGQPSPGARGR